MTVASGIPRPLTILFLSPSCHSSNVHVIELERNLPIADGVR
jgi:hypothetical protein